ncbi:MAG: carboxymuconolactone decarboxylase family protein [Pseudomonadota bacterium]
MKHELKPIESPFPDDVAQVLKQYPQGDDGYIIQLFRVFANSMRFLANKGVVNLLDEDSPLSLREREIVILRVTANKDCEYEWGVHVSVFSQTAGLNGEQIAATRMADSQASCWAPEESLLIQCVDELCQYAKIQDNTYDRFQTQWNLEQQLEVLALCGNYHTVSFVANTSRIAPESMGIRFPS